MTKTTFKNNKTRNILLTILLIAPLFVSGIAANQYVFAVPLCVTDVDQDGFCAEVDDCDDSDFDVNPEASEVDNGIDDNCDGNIDEGFDTDNDGFTPIDGGDCDDTDNTIFPGAPEVLGDGVDQDCNGADTLGESEKGFFWKEVQIECADGLDISSGAPQSCDLWITIHEELEGFLIDSIPAHLDVDSVEEESATCDDGVFANAHGKSKNNSERVTSATLVSCEIEPEDVDTEIHIFTDTRASPSNSKSNNPNHVDKWSPTGCGLFEVNGGLIYFEEVDEFGIPIILDTMDPVFVHTTPDDLDCDGVDNTQDICEGFDDNVDTDGDGVPDGCDICADRDDTVDADGDGLTCAEEGNGPDDDDACIPDDLNENCNDD